MGSIVPSRLYRIKLFESHEVFKKVEDGWLRVAEESDDILEHQISAWVDETKVLVVTTGPLNIIDRSEKFEPKVPDGPLGEVGLVLTRRETRTLSVIYAPPVEQGDFLYGEQPTKQEAGSVRKVQPDVGSGNPMSARRISDADLVSGGGPPGS